MLTNLNSFAMKIEHVALWVKNLETMADFYCHYFQFQKGNIYRNETKGFSSIFLKSRNGNTRLELMHKKEFQHSTCSIQYSYGYAHIAFSVGSCKEVDALTSTLLADEIKVINGPRTTGDGYYESIVLDPEGNQIEITI